MTDVVDVEVVVTTPVVVTEVAPEVVVSAFVELDVVAIAVVESVEELVVKDALDMSQAVSAKDIRTINTNIRFFMNDSPLLGLLYNILLFSPSEML